MRNPTPFTYVVIFAICVVIAGCATKRYGRVAPLSQTERNLYTCREIEIEIAKVTAFAEKIKKDSRFNGLSVLSFLADYGIGNVLEHDQAMTSARTRYQELKALEKEKQCVASVAPVAPPATGVVPPTVPPTAAPASPGPKR